MEATRRCPQENGPRALQQSFAGGFIRFDGEDDFLFASHLGRVLTNAMVFLVAAPRANQERFLGFFSMSKHGKNDYTTGLNLDLGFEPTPKLSAINVEGAGFSGAVPRRSTAVSFMQAPKKSPIFCWFAFRGPVAFDRSSRMPHRNRRLSSRRRTNPENSDSPRRAREKSEKSTNIARCDLPNPRFNEWSNFTRKSIARFLLRELRVLRGE